jgi:Flp pilus assembly protein TadB
MPTWSAGWPVAANVLAAPIAALCALGVVVLGIGIYRLRYRATTARRVAALLAEDPLSTSPDLLQVAVQPPPRWLLELRQVLAQIEARDSTLRGPTVALACVFALVGLASVSVVWIVLAVLAALAAFALGARERRHGRIEAQALDAMQLFASGLRAGYSVPQAIVLVSRHSSEPTAAEFGLAAQELSVGVPLADAMTRLAKRTANADYELVSIIVRVQHEVGGNLAQILDSVGHTLRERFELRRQVDAVTAQQRLSSLVLSVLPFGLLMFLFVMDRSFVEPLFTQPIGRLMLALSAVMVFIGWTIMNSIGRVEV